MFGVEELIKYIYEFVFTIKQIKDFFIKTEEIKKGFAFDQSVSSRQNYWVFLESGSSVDIF